MHRIVLNAPGSSEGSAKKSKVFFLLLKHIWAHTAKKDGNVTTRN
jgi:hypothetical protein